MKRIDHIIIKAENFDEAIQDFTDAGFKVYYGSKKEKAYNALIYLQDHSFIELLKTQVVPPLARLLTKWGVFRVISPIFHRLGNFYFKKGPILDYPVYSANIKAFHERVKKSSSNLKEDARRKKPDGTVVTWKCFMPKKLHLPFVMSDYHPQKMSENETDTHPNGITGIKNIDIRFNENTALFKGEIQDFYQISKSNIKDTDHGFSVTTDNAIINYIESDDHSISLLTLSPASGPVNDKLGKYGVTSAN